MAANLLSFDFIRGRLSAEQLEDLAVSLGICLDCGGNLVSRDGEIVCGQCGLVWAIENAADYVPFPENVLRRTLHPIIDPFNKQLCQA